MLKNKSAYNQYMKEYMLNRYYARRDAAIVIFGGKCSKCESTDSLEFDHIDPSTKKFTIAKMWSLNDLAYKQELNKCQLLCNKCHKDKSKNEGSFGDKEKIKICKCGRIFETIKSYAGHKTWCK